MLDYDVNDDGDVDVEDVNELVELTLTEDDLGQQYDFDQDGSVDGSDAEALDAIIDAETVDDREQDDGASSDTGGAGGGLADSPLLVLAVVAVLGAGVAVARRGGA